MIKPTVNRGAFPGQELQQVRQPQIATAQPEPRRSGIDKAIKTGVDVVDTVTGLPGRVSDKMDDLNDRMIDLANKFRSGADDAAGKAEENLTQNKIKTIGRKAAEWLSNPQNAIMAGIGVVVAIFLIRKT